VRSTEDVRKMNVGVDIRYLGQHRLTENNSF